MRKISVEIPEGQLDLLDQLVTEKMFPTRNEAINEAIRTLLQYHGKL